MGKVFLGTVSDLLIIKKKASLSQQETAGVISNALPESRISWITDDVCSVISDAQAIDNGLDALMSNDYIVSVRPAYIRSTYAELMALYPVGKVALYGFDEKILLKLKDGVSESDKEDLGTALSLTVVDENNVFYTWAAGKTDDILAKCIRLYESGKVYGQSPIG